jgi:pyruvate carboxylase
LITTIKKNCDGLPLEFHSHCTAGLAPLCYLEAVQAGVETLHTAVSPLANGTSLPSIENILKNTRHLGFSDNIDDEALEAVSTHFREIAEREGFPIGIPVEYDLFHYEHQVPGGMMTNLKRQLKEMKMEHRLDEFLEEIIRVRKEFGYPVMATPFSQIVGAQAVENVVLGERYKRILDESIKYIGGHYGEPAAPIDPNLLDRIEQDPEAKKLLDWKPQGRLKTLQELRNEIGPEFSDEEFLLRVLIPGRTSQSGSGKKANTKVFDKDQGGARDEKKTSMGPLPEHPREFHVDVDGEVFNVKISPAHGRNEYTIEEDRGEIRPTGSRRSQEIPRGAVVPMMAGMVVSIKVKVGQTVHQGDLLATIEAMKMIREVNASHSGVVEEICTDEGEMVEAEDILMVVVPNDE